MSSIMEIEQVLRQMSREDRWEIVRWLLDDLQDNTSSHTAPESSGDNGQAATRLPDYAARRRRIFGNKVLPNMVLAARAEEPW